MSTSKFSNPFMMKSPLSPLKGNAFIKAKMDAEAAGKSSFVVDGKNYPLKMVSPLNEKGDPCKDERRKTTHKEYCDRREAMDKSRKQKEDSIFKDIGGREGMKSMQVKMKNGTATEEEIAAFNKAVEDYKNKKKKK